MKFDFLNKWLTDTNSEGEKTHWVLLQCNHVEENIKEEEVFDNKFLLRRILCKTNE